MKNNVTQIVNDFSFSDASVLFLGLEGQSVRLKVRNWQEKTFEFIFENVIFTKAFSLGDIVEHQLLTDSPELSEAKQFMDDCGENLDTMGTLYHLKLVNDGAFLQIIFAGLQINLIQ
jgi:hypothetical protein